MVFDLNNIVRENIRRLVPYSSAREEYNWSAQIFLDANENSFGSPLSEDYSRYPDPTQTALKRKIAGLNQLDPAQIFVGNGSDEVIDLLVRTFCRPGIDSILVCPPTYGMYEVAAAVNDVAVKRVNLTADFQLDTDTVCKTLDEKTKLIFLCSPNNPTGNSLSRQDILRLIRTFDGIVVVDEAYVHFSDQGSLLSEIDNFPNLVVLQTFSKAWGLAGMRVGLAFADRRIAKLLNKIKPPYNVSQMAQNMTLAALENWCSVEKMIAEIKQQRSRLAERLRRFPVVQAVYPSDANFLLVKFVDGADVYQFLVREQIIVRDRSNIALCASCLRITIGTADENDFLIAALAGYPIEGGSNK